MSNKLTEQQARAYAEVKGISHGLSEWLLVIFAKGYSLRDARELLRRTLKALGG